MNRIVPTLVLEILITIALSFAILAAWQWLLAGSLLAGLSEGAYLLFFFNDVAMAVWIVILIVLAVRRKRVPGFGITLGAALAGVLVNVAMVTAIGFAQQGWFAFYVLFAIEAGAAFLLAVAVVVPVVRRLRRPRAS